jgi:hypothetical protein
MNKFDLLQHWNDNIGVQWPSTTVKAKESICQKINFNNKISTICTYSYICHKDIQTKQVVDVARGTLRVSDIKP